MVQKDREKIITKNAGIEYEIQYRQKFCRRKTV